MTDRQRAAEAFIAEMIARDVLVFGDFVLKSGRQSPYFFNLGRVADGAGLRAVGTAYASLAMQLPELPEVFFGPAYKGIPIATATAMAMHLDHARAAGAAYNRKEAKSHGEGGALVGADMTGKKVAIVDDVVTDGAAKREALATVADAGGDVVGILLALDRQEPSAVGAEATATQSSSSATRTVAEQPMPGRVETAVQALIRASGVPVLCVATLDDVIGYLRRQPGSETRAQRLVQHRELTRDSMGLANHV